MTWSVNPTTVTYHAHIATPTGIPTDPALTSYGEKQAEQLGEHIATLHPQLSQIYSSPYYRCLQTLKPGVERLLKRGYSRGVIVDNGFEEWYGETGDHREHPRPAPFEELRDAHFPSLQLRQLERAVIKSSRFGESIQQLHERIAYALHRIIELADRDGATSILICTHAAAMIAIGRTLTGTMPEDVDTEDFKCFTAGLSRYDRTGGVSVPTGEVALWDAARERDIPDVGWKDGKGIMGGWDCVLNSDCSFLDGGEERGWHFSGDESFLRSSGPDGCVVERGLQTEFDGKGDAIGKGSRL